MHLSSSRTLLHCVWGVCSTYTCTGAAANVIVNNRVPYVSHDWNIYRWIRVYAYLWGESGYSCITLPIYRIRWTVNIEWRRATGTWETRPDNGSSSEVACETWRKVYWRVFKEYYVGTGRGARKSERERREVFGGDNRILKNKCKESWLS